MGIMLGVGINYDLGLAREREVGGWLDTRYNEQATPVPNPL